MILIEYNLLAIFLAAVMATLGWRFGMILVDQITHISHKFWSFLRSGRADWGDRVHHGIW